MDSRTLDRWSKLCQCGWCERKRPLKDEWLRYLLVGKECERNFRGAAFLAPEAGPEGGIDNCLDRLRIGFGGQLLLAPLQPRDTMTQLTQPAAGIQKTMPPLLRQWYSRGNSGRPATDGHLHHLFE